MRCTVIAVMHTSVCAQQGPGGPPDSVSCVSGLGFVPWFVPSVLVSWRPCPLSNRHVETKLQKGALLDRFTSSVIAHGQWRTSFFDSHAARSDEGSGHYYRVSLMNTHHIRLHFLVQLQPPMPENPSPHSAVVCQRELRGAQRWHRAVELRPIMQLQALPHPLRRLSVHLSSTY